MEVERVVEAAALRKRAHIQVEDRACTGPRPLRPADLESLSHQRSACLHDAEVEVIVRRLCVVEERQLALDVRLPRSRGGPLP